MTREKTWGVVFFRGLLFIGVPLLGWYLYNHYEIVALAAEEDGMTREPRDPYAPGSSVLVDLRPDKIWGGDLVLFRLPESEDFRIARVHGVGGDKLEMGPKGLQVNGATVLRGKDPFALLSEETLQLKMIPPERFLLFNDNIHSLRKDSRELGLISAEWVFGRVVRPWPW